MFSCKRCEKEFSEGATCSICMGRYDFPCAGITESGWKKLGDRKSTWKCSACKSVGVSPRTGLAKTVSTDTEAILIELKRLSTQMETLPMLMDSIKSIHNEIAELKTMRAELSDVKSSIEFVHSSVIDVTNKVSCMEQDIEHLKSTKDDISNLRERCNRLELQTRANEQRSRLNNIEIKGVPTLKIFSPS